MRKEIILIVLWALIGFAPAKLTAQSQPNIPTKTTIIQKPVQTGGYGVMLFKMFLALLLVCILAFIILKWGMGRLVAHTSKDAQMKVLSRMTIEPRRSVMVVRVASRTLVLATSEAGVELLTELHGQDAQSFDMPNKGEDEQKLHQKRAFSLPKTDEKDTL